jgi:hypothetical protein
MLLRRSDSDPRGLLATKAVGRAGPAPGAKRRPKRQGRMAKPLPGQTVWRPIAVLKAGWRSLRRDGKQPGDRADSAAAIVASLWNYIASAAIKRATSSEASWTRTLAQSATLPISLRSGVRPGRGAGGIFVKAEIFAIHRRPPMCTRQIHRRSPMDNYEPNTDDRALSSFVRSH